MRGSTNVDSSSLLLHGILISNDVKASDIIICTHTGRICPIHMYVCDINVDLYFWHTTSQTCFENISCSIESRSFAALQQHGHSVDLNISRVLTL